MVQYFFKARIASDKQKKYLPLAGFSISAQGSTLTVDITLPSNESYADLPAGTVVVIEDDEGKEVVRAVYAGFNASKTSYQYSQTLQFLHPVNVLMNAPFSFPVSSLSWTVYESSPEMVLYKLIGGQDLKPEASSDLKKSSQVAVSFFQAVLGIKNDNLLELFQTAAKWSKSLQGLMNRYLDAELRAGMAQTKLGIKAAAEHYFLLAEKGKLDTPTFVNMAWILDTLLAYSNRALFIEPDGTPVVRLADNVTTNPDVTISRANIEQVGIWYSWIQPTAAVAFMGQELQGPSYAEIPFVVAVYDGVNGTCVNGYNFKAIEGLASNMAFGTYSPQSISVYVPFLPPDKSSLSADEQRTFFNQACNYARRHYWRLYKSTNTYELVVPLFTVRKGVGQVCAFGLNDKIFFGQIVGITHHWSASGESYTKVAVQGVRGYQVKDMAKFSNLLADQQPSFWRTTPRDPQSLPGRTITVF